MHKVITSLLIFIFTFFVFSVTKVSAKILANEKGDVSVAKTEVINDDLFIGAQTAEVAGTVNGDVFIGAQTAKITGVINGNLHVGANTLDLGGVVKGNVYTGAQSVLVNGSTIGGSLIVGAATVNIDKDSSIGGSILAGAGALSIESQVKRSVYAGTGSLTIGSDAKIGKDLYYASNQEQADIASGAVAGTIHKSEIKVAEKEANIEAARKSLASVFGGLKVAGTIISLLGALIVGFLYFKLFGGHLKGTAGIISKSFWKSIGVGFLVTIAFIPGLVILLITIIGIPIAGLAFLFLLLYFYLSKIVAGLAFGDWLSEKFNRKMSIYGSLALGLVVIYILKLVPVVGFLSGLVVFWVGLGALTLRTFSKSE